jgi:DNA-binding transcriptional LysR family regulator
MELRDIEYFAVVADHGNLGRAAEALGLSTPALSKSLRRLEGALDAKLVKRTTKGVELTPEGQALLLHVKRLRLSLADVAREIAHVRQGRAGHLRIGTTTGTLEDLVGATCGLFFEEAHSATLTVNLVAQEELLPALREGKLDLAVGIISATSAPDLVHQHLFDDAFAVYASPRHRLAGRTHVKLEDIAKERWIRNAATGFSRQAFNRVFEENALAPPSTALESASNAVRLHVAATSDLLFFAPQSTVRLAAPRFELVQLPVKELKYARRNMVSYRSDAHLPPAGHRFIALLKTMAKKLADK